MTTASRTAFVAVSEPSVPTTIELGIPSASLDPGRTIVTGWPGIIAAGLALPVVHIRDIRDGALARFRRFIDTVKLAEVVAISACVDCHATASRACIGSRKMSAKAAATGIRHAQAVIASACVGGGLAKAEKKIVPRAATPIALESCCTASSTPEAEPTSS